jgi:cytochrome P450
MDLECKIAILRYPDIADTIPRVTVADQGHPGGTVVFMSLAAVRDQAVFPDAERFDVRRERGNHLSFSCGVHQRRDQNLGRARPGTVLSTLFPRVPGPNLHRHPGQSPWSCRRSYGLRHGRSKRPLPSKGSGL